jgi:peptidoglycan/LPS O-acetylase OafA/YrhL
LKLEPATSYRPDVDGLRAIAVLCVIGFHAFPDRVAGGFIGVDIFFVISGFLISGIILGELRRGRFNYLQFYKRRIRRIFPALLVVMSTALLVGWFLLLPDDFKQLARETAASAAFGANLLFWSESGYFDGNAASKPLLHLWSLGVEEQFYLAWPLILAALVRRSRRLVSLVAGLMLASFALNIAFVHTHPSASFYLPITRFWELLTGGLLACAAYENPMSLFGRSIGSLTAKPVTRETCGWLGLALIGASLWLLKPSSAFPGWWAVLPVIGTFLILAARNGWLNRVLLSNRALVFVGLISYPLYLWHWVALSFLHLHFHDGADVAPASQRVAAVSVSFILAWATYELIERPIRFGSRSALVPVSLLLSMLFVGVCGLSLDLSDGGAWRYPPAIRPLVAFDYDRERDKAETAYRADRCFLDKLQTFADIAGECVDNRQGTAPLLVLWGDSHAASLYPGLKALQDRRGGFRIAQFTASFCPPILNVAFRQRPNCREFNSAVFSKLLALKPSTVLLMGHWRRYAVLEEREKEFDLGALSQTIMRLKTAGVNRVVVIGCLPEWRIAQPKVSVSLWRQTGSIVARTNDYLSADSSSVDRTVQQVAVSSGALFVSPLRALCDLDGCLLSAVNQGPLPLAWDTAHLTNGGSEYLMRLIGDQLVGLLPTAAEPLEPAN